MVVVNTTTLTSGNWLGGIWIGRLRYGGGCCAACVCLAFWVSLGWFGLGWGFVGGGLVGRQGLKSNYCRGRSVLNILLVLCYSVLDSITSHIIEAVTNIHLRGNGDFTPNGICNRIPPNEYISYSNCNTLGSKCLNSFTVHSTYSTVGAASFFPSS